MPESPAPDMVNQPPHYLAHPSGIECIEITRYLPFSIGNATKYVWRFEGKNGLEDLNKAMVYINDCVQHRVMVPELNAVVSDRVLKAAIADMASGTMVGVLRAPFLLSLANPGCESLTVMRHCITQLMGVK